jgi:hypothetical protein
VLEKFGMAKPAAIQAVPEPEGEEKRPRVKAVK